MKRATLPLGVDVGAARVRIALCERERDGAIRLVAVAARPALGDPAAALADAHAELNTRERRCVLALGVPDTVLRTASFPPMSVRERERAARYEAARFAPFGLDDAAVRVAPLGDGRCAVAVARRSALDAAIAVARRARLRPVAVDDASLALARAFPYADALVDVGDGATILVVPGEPLPAARRFEIGGRAFTAALVASLGVDEAAAEQRKRSVGLAGAGDYALDGLIEQLAGALIDARAARRTELREIVLCGNGSRLAGFPEALERAVAIPVRSASLAAHAAPALAADVVRAASPDWGLACGLALWDAAA